MPKSKQARRRDERKQKGVSPERNAFLKRAEISARNFLAGA
jgi:hypothetical protein